MKPVYIQPVEMPQGNPAVVSLGEKIGVPMKSANDLMQWVLFGEQARFFESDKRNAH
jgi:hypothetical protein